MPLQRFLETKFHIPAWRASGVPRPRLVEQLQVGLDEYRRLTLISAPAGYGKSTLVAEWIHSLPTGNVKAAWLSMDESDNSSTRFISYFLNAFQRIDPALGLDGMSLISLPELAALTPVLDQLLNDLSGLHVQCILVIDDYHLITNPIVHEVVAYFLDNLPAHVHLVITTRADPPLPMARLRAHRQLTEIRSYQLRFTSDETRQFFHQALQSDMKPEWISALEDRTEGWAAGLQLASLALQNLPDQQDFIRTFHGSHRYILDYLAEEVIRQQGEDICRFLMQTSVLDRFNAPLCDAITGRSDSQSLIAHLEAANLFLVPLDHARDWYRYHHLFGDYLRTGLSTSEQADLLEKASAWHAAQDLPFEAVRYALASGNMDYAADLIDRVIQYVTAWSSGAVSILTSWLDALPPHALHNRPMLSLNASRVLYLTGQVGLSEAVLTKAEMNLHTLTPAERERWLITAASYHGAIAALRGEVQRAIQLTSETLQTLPEDEELVRARAFFTLGLAYDSKGETSRALQFYLQSSMLAQSAGATYLAINTRCEVALLHIQMGDLNQAEQSCREALQLAGEPPIPPAGLAWAVLGEIARERNQLEDARRCLFDGMEQSKQGGIIEDLRAEYLFLARLEAAEGHFSGAQSALNKAAVIMKSYNTSRITTLAEAIQARLHLASGDLSSAMQWARQYQALRQDYAVEYLREFEDLTLAAILSAAGELQQASDILAPLIEQAQAGGRKRTCLEAYLLQAQILHSLNHPSAALQSLEQAVRLAAHSGFIRLLLEIPEALIRLLPQARPIAPHFVDDVLVIITGERGGSAGVAKPRAGQEELIKPLSDQEQRVLQLIVAGKSNAEIADELVISVGTAKWHVHNILQKLDVSNRPQAIARARELGLY
jgi:LuxR family transcriptional regulator, maltose regulon positive regulatory protein